MRCAIPLIIILLVYLISILLDYSRQNDPIGLWPHGLKPTHLFNQLIVRPFSNPRHNVPFPPLDAFPYHKTLEENWKIIRNEALNLYNNGQSKKIKGDLFFRKIIADNKWHRFYIKWYGPVSQKAKRWCPKTVKLINGCDQIKLAMFSILKPGTVIKRHTGGFMGCFRYHLGLVTPGPKCVITVDGKPYTWKDGEGVLFDDTYTHSVRNDEDSIRIILFCDVKRPLKGFANKINEFVIEKLIYSLTGKNRK